MKNINLADHPYFVLLLVWRAILAVLALHSVIEKPFDAMLMALAVIGLFALIGELAYTQKVQRDNERRRQQVDRERREQRAAEARLRLEAARAAEQANGGKSFGLDDDEPPAATPVANPSSIAALSAKELDASLREAELASKGA